MRTDAVDVLVVVPSPAPSEATPVPGTPTTSTAVPKDDPLGSPLPRTGADLLAVLLAALLLLAVGALLHRSARQRRRAA